MLLGKIQNPAVTPRELNLGLLPLSVRYNHQRTSRHHNSLCTLYKRATDLLHIHQARLVVTWLKLTTQLSTILRGEHWDKHYWY